MQLRLPSEIVVDDVLPTLRVQLARQLADRGFTQEQIATHIGVTQASVSKYVSGDVTIEERIAQDSRTQATLERIADGFVAGDMDGYDAIAELLDLVRHLEDRGPICELHEEAMPALQGLGCDLCVRGTDTQMAVERDVLSNVRRGARILATTAHMAAYVPNVGANVGYALPDAADPTHVAAIPGRIYALGGRVEVPANPEFGASKHVATVVLAAAAIDPGVRGAVNLATDDTLLTAAADLGMDRLEFDAEYEDRDSRLRTQFETRGTVPDVLYHRGAFGIEPITYVLGESAEDAARRAATLVAHVHDDTSP